MQIQFWVQTLVTIIIAIGASGGFWAYLQSRDKEKSATTKLLMGLAYDQIHTRGMSHIGRGWITSDEYDELNKYFFEPYKALGGNGTAERVMAVVGQLPLKNQSLATEIIKAKRNWSEDE